MERETQPAFFQHRQTPRAKLALFGGLALVLLVTDLQYRYLNVIRENVSIALYPLQRVATLPAQLGEQAYGFLASHASLERENQALRLAQLQSSAEVARAKQLEQENQSLRTVLSLKTQASGDAQIAELLYAGRDPFTRRIIINKGLRSDVVEGSPVYDGTGLVGQVTRVHQLVSEVTLITDKGFPVPVEIQRTGQRTVAFGTGEPGLLELRYLPVSADLKDGDLLVTSGIDGTYPAGLPVARVGHIERNSALPFARVPATPLGGVDKSRFLLIVDHHPDLPDYPTPPPETPASNKKKRK